MSDWSEVWLVCDSGWDGGEHSNKKKMWNENVGGVESCKSG